MSLKEKLSNTEKHGSVLLPESASIQTKSNSAEDRSPTPLGTFRISLTLLVDKREAKDILDVEVSSESRSSFSSY